MSNRGLSIVVAVVAGVLYVATMGHGVLWGDSGNAQVRTLHEVIYSADDPPRSHVVYYACTVALSRLGLSAALAATLVSALAGAAIVGLLTLLMSQLELRRAAVVSAVACIMVSHALWHEATVAEVMTFSTMLLCLELCLVVTFLKSQKRGWFVAALFVNGVGLATHQMALLIWPAYVVLIAMCLRSKQRLRPGTLAAGACAWLVGALPLIILIVMHKPEETSLSAILMNTFAGRYREHVFNMGISTARVAKMLAYSCYSFPTPLLIAIAPGLVVLYRNKPADTFWFLVLAFAGFFGFAIRYNVVDQHAFMLHSFIFAAIFLAYGLDHWLSNSRLKRSIAMVFALSVPAPIVYAVVPEILRGYAPELAPLPNRETPYRDRFEWFLKPWRSKERDAERFARETLEQLPKNAILVVDSTRSPPILYLQASENLRKDVRVNGAGLFQPWLPDTFRLEDVDERDAAIGGGMMFTITEDREHVNFFLRDSRYGFRQDGTVFQVTFGVAGNPPD